MICMSDFYLSARRFEIYAFWIVWVLRFVQCFFKLAYLSRLFDPLLDMTFFLRVLLKEVM
jgi:hypothetical protein